MDRDKTQMALVDLSFVRKMAAVLHGGNRRSERKPGDWRERTWDAETVLEYRSALLRHLLAAETDPEAYAAVAVNAMILAECQDRDRCDAKDKGEMGGPPVLRDLKEWRCSLQGVLAPVFHWYLTYGHPVCGSDHTTEPHDFRITPTTKNLKEIAYCNTCVDRLRNDVTALGLTSSEAEDHVESLLDLLDAGVAPAPLFEGWKTLIESGDLREYHWYHHEGVPICGADVKLPGVMYASISPEIKAPICEVCVRALAEQGVSNYGMTKRQVRDALPSRHHRTMRKRRHF